MTTERSRVGSDMVVWRPAQGATPPAVAARPAPAPASFCRVFPVLLRSAAMAQRLVKLGLVQTAVSADKAKNLAKTARLVGEAADRGARVVCLQELFASEYFCQREDAAL